MYVYYLLSVTTKINLKILDIKNEIASTNIDLQLRVIKETVASKVKEANVVMYNIPDRNENKDDLNTILNQINIS